jgi:ubiquinone/menaquinone biosynthesis C-methylase UbiE
MVDPTSTAENWNTYWRGAAHGAAFSAGGTSHPVVLGFWEAYFSNALDTNEEPKVIDIASGTGAVVASAKSACNERMPDFTCVDISDSAIRSLKHRFPSVHGVVADVCNIPLDSHSFDIATSQFGLEYAGLNAIDEIIRLLSSRGQIALLLHHRDGGIYRQCAASLDATNKLIAAGFVPHAKKMFQAGFEFRRSGSREPFEAAGRQFMPVIRTMESIMRQYGQHVADGTILRLYRDVRTIHTRMPNYDETEVLDWLRKMQDELEAYAGRMESMCTAALNADDFSALCDKLTNRRFKLLRNDPLRVPDRDTALAWALLAIRS